MLTHYFKIALRTIKHQKSYSFINIAGLTIGLTISLAIAFYVIDDLTFDRFHRDAEDIYRVLTLENSSSGSLTYSITAGPLIPASVDDIPEVLAATRSRPIGGSLIAAGDVARADMNESNSIRLQGFMTEPEFFDVFGFDFIRGDQEQALSDPSGVLLTPEAAETLFDGLDPIGQRLTVRGVQDAYVIGLVERPPTNSHIQFDFIQPLIIANNPLWWDSWENFTLQGYMKLEKNASKEVVEKKMLDLARAHGMPAINIPTLQPLLDVHLGSADHHYDNSNQGKNDETVVYALAVIGFLIILVAAINFINLSTARASGRAREVGMRKVVGASKGQLTIQFLGESVALTLIAMLLSVGILQISLPYLDGLLGKHLDISFLDNPLLLVTMFGVAVVIGILSGLYPAFVLSAFKPVTVLRGKFEKTGIGSSIRKILVLLQFAITISLTIAVLVIYDQIGYLTSMDMGYNRDQVVTMFAQNNRGDLFKNRLSTLPGVVAAGRSSGVLGSNFIRYEVIPEGATREEGRMFQQIALDGSFLDVLEIGMAAGRGFSVDFPSDTANSILINETAAKKAGWDAPLGKRLDMVEVDGSITSKRVVGVVKDFHFTGARQAIEPLFFQLNTQNTFLFVVKLAGGQITETMDRIQKVYEEVYPGRNFNFQFLDDVFDQQFDADREFATNIAYFSGIAIIIACLGLIGLVAFAVSERKAEIAIRKVLGSSEGQVIFLLAKDFLKWVLIANFIAWPLSYYAIGLWLDGFVYKVSLTPFPFFLSGFAAMTLALVTMSYQSIRAAHANPADSLRNE